MMSFLAVVLAVVLGFALLMQPAVGRLLEGLAALLSLMLVVFLTSLIIWLALFGSG